MLQYTKDLFQGGKFVLTQPVKGYRAGLDSMLLAATVPSTFSGNLADFGSGAGAVGMAIALRCPKAQVALVENMPEMIFCARKTLEDPHNQEFSSRMHIIEADLTLEGKERIAQGLDNDSFDFVVMNPPFNSFFGTPSANKLKYAAHTMIPDLPEKWLKNAAAVVKQKGRISIITRVEMVPKFLDAMHPCFRKIYIIPIYSREHKPAIRVIIYALCAQKSSFSVCSPLFLYEGLFNHLTKEAQSIIQGEKTFFAD